jgi:hypothetical protein
VLVQNPASVKIHTVSLVKEALSLLPRLKVAEKRIMPFSAVRAIELWECDGNDNLFYDTQIGITTHPQI